MSALVVVTGAGSGIGRATALRFATTGARVVCADIDEHAARRTARDCGDASLGYRVDIADAQAVRTFADAVMITHGVPDVVVNNAGVGMTGRLDEMKIDDWNWIRSINLDGVVHGCHAFGPAMLGRGTGHIINVSSGLAYTPRATEPAYVATKAGVLALSRSLRADWGPRGVNVTAICPGIINTPIIDATAYIGSQEASRESGRKLFSRGHSPDKVARAIVRATRKDRAVTPVGVESWGGWFLSRFGPMWMQERVARQDLGTLARVDAGPVSGTPFTVTTDDGASLAGDVLGEGHSSNGTVVLAHCWTGNRTMWDDVATRLAADGHRVVRYDHRGHGASTLGRDATDLPRLATDLLTVLDATDTTDAVLVGHSLGGMTIQQLAIERPDVLSRMRGVVLVATSAKLAHGARRAKVLERAVASERLSRVAPLQGARGAFGRKPKRAHLRLTRDAFVATGAATRHDILRVMHAMDLRTLRDTGVPVTVISGQRDKLTPPAFGREIAQRVGAAYVEVPGAGHMLPLEAPETVVLAVRAGAGSLT